MGLVFAHTPLPGGQEQLCKMAQKETSKELVALVLEMLSAGWRSNGVLWAVADMEGGQKDLGQIQ